MLTRELKGRLLAAGAVLKVADNPSAEVLDAKSYLKLPSEYMSLMHEAQREEIGLRWAAAARNALERGKREAERMREVFRRRVVGESFSAIGRAMRWSHSTTRQRITNPVYMGVDGLVPAIVTGSASQKLGPCSRARAAP
jgi:hypothetical protein